MGAVVVPLSSVATGGSLVSLADPVITDLLSKFKAVLRDKLDTAWNSAASQTSSHVVEGTYACAPAPMTGRGWKWPALFMWRDRERLFYRTSCYRCAESTGHLLFILPPMPYEQAIRLDPIRTAVRTVLDLYNEQHGDPDTASGACPMTANTLEAFTFNEAEYGYEFDDKLHTAHPVLDLTWTMRERQAFVDDNYVTLSRIETTIEVMPEDAATSGVDLVVTHYGAVASSGFSSGFSSIGFY